MKYKNRKDERLGKMKKKEQKRVEKKCNKKFRIDNNNIKMRR